MFVIENHAKNISKIVRQTVKENSKVYFIYNDKIKNGRSFKIYGDTNKIADRKRLYNIVSQALTDQSYMSETVTFDSVVKGSGQKSQKITRLHVYHA